MFIYCMDDILNHSYIDEKNEEEGEKSKTKTHKKWDTTVIYTIIWEKKIFVIKSGKINRKKND